MYIYRYFSKKFWLFQLADHDSGNYDKRKIKSLCGLTSTIANLAPTGALFKKKNSKRYIGLDMGKNGHNS